MRSGPPIAALLPHQRPFRFVDVVVAIEPNRGRFELQLEANDERLIAGRLPALFLVEALAQAAAAYHGLGDGKREAGFLVEIRDARLHGDAAAEQNIILLVECQRRLGAMVRFYGRAERRGTLLAEAFFTVARAATGDAID